MSGKLRLNGATSGYSELQAPDVAGDQTFTLPATGGELVTKQGGGSVVGYQQGVWVPVCSLACEIVDPGWNRIGNRVEVAFRSINFESSSSSTGLSWGGLPYPPALALGDRGEIGPLMISKAETQGNGGATYLSTSGDLQVYLNGNSDTQAWVGLKHKNVNPNTLIILKVSYMTNDTTWQPINGATIS